MSFEVLKNIAKIIEMVFRDKIGLEIQLENVLNENQTLRKENIELYKKVSELESKLERKPE